MIASAVAFSALVLSVHIMAVVVGFGVTFAYPIFFSVAERVDRRSLPALHQLQLAVSRRLINPGLLVVLLAGIYLASDKHQWKHFYVQWGIAMVVVLGGLEGGVMVPRVRKMAEIGSRDLAAVPAGSASGGEWSPEYLKLRSQVAVVGGAMSFLVLVTIVLMATRAGA